MPYIETKTNVTITKEQEIALKTAFGKAIGIIPGKTEQWLMLGFSDSHRMWFAGEDAPCVLLEVELLGSTTSEVYDALSAELTKIVSETLAVPPSGIYIKYEEIGHWGWNGGNF
jgi:phenylpyruvate tautomerase PptA (4-oxalocrotonate tautomerase family)